MHPETGAGQLLHCRIPLENGVSKMGQVLNCNFRKSDQLLICEFRIQPGREDRWPKTYNSRPDPPIALVIPDCSSDNSLSCSLI